MQTKSDNLLVGFGGKWLKKAYQTLLIKPYYPLKGGVE